MTADQPATPKPNLRWYQYSLRTLFILTLLVALLSGWWGDHSRLQQKYESEMAALKASHKYNVIVKGTPGVRLSMTVFTKPASKKTDVITVPYSQSFEAIAAGVWCETLPDGKSGKNGDKYQILFVKDGITSRECNGHIQKDSRNWMYCNGDATFYAGDF